MRLFYLGWVTAFFLCSSFHVSTLAQALPNAQPERVNRALSGVLQESMRARGFAANDPRYGNTLARISPSLSAVAGTSAAAVTVGAVTAPAWATVALAAGVGAVVTYAVSLGIDSLVRWLFRSDNKIDESSDAAVVNADGMEQGGAYWKVTFHSAPIHIDLAGGDGEALARQGYFEYLSQSGQNTQKTPTCSGSASQFSCGIIHSYKQSAGAPASCVSGALYQAGACVPYSFEMPPPVPAQQAVMPLQAISNIPADDLDKTLNPQVLAGLANRAWAQAASQPGYDGLPYPQSQPITQAEVQPWLKANPEYAPTVRDFVAPNIASDTSAGAWSLPSNPISPSFSPEVANSNTTNPAQSSSQVNLGADPGIGAPALESIPTAQQIAAPILGLAPELRAFEASGHAGVCPTYTIELYGSHMLDAHCKLIEDNKQVLQLAMAFAWAAMALLIVLSA